VLVEFIDCAGVPEKYSIVALLKLSALMQVH
jgi:hypothetical protein